MKNYYRDEPLNLGEQLRLTIMGSEVRIVAKPGTSWPERIKRQGYKPSYEGQYVVVFEESRDEFRLQIPEALSQVIATKTKRMQERQAAQMAPTQSQEAP